MSELRLLMGMCLLLAFSCNEKKTKVKEIKKGDMKTRDPISTINQGTTLTVDFSGMGADNSVIFFDSTCVVTGKKGAMKMLVANPEFNPLNLPVDLRTKIFNIREVNLSVGNPYEDQECQKTNPPEWLNKMSKLLYLRLEDMKISNLSFLQNRNIKRLTLIRTDFDNRDIILNDISKLADLDYLVSNNLFTPKEVTHLKRMIPELVVLSLQEYEKRMVNGEITIP